MQSPEDPPKTAGHLAANILVFARLLRTLGIDAHPSAVMELTRALDLVGIKRRDELYFTARSLLVTRLEQLTVFERAFELFWHLLATHESVQLEETLPPTARAEPPKVEEPVSVGLAAIWPAPPSAPAPEKQEPAGILASRTYSPAELLRRKDFGSLSQEELEEVKRLMAELVLDLGSRRSRRWLRAGSHPVDIHDSIRRSLRAGGEMFELIGREPKWKPRPLVVLADISGSMERYSGLLLRFICGMARSQARPIEAFVFSTQLTHITPHLLSRDVERVVAEITRSVPDWSGGTRIGKSLKTFNFRWGRRVLGRGAVVLLISDGWDRGDIELLGREMARLQRRSHRLIWLNPLLGSPLYEPLTMGLQAALPVVDDFLPIHNLESLEQLAGELDRLGP
ncbi:MAG: vWA domain-containing protein, partial [Anaerolineales bacterium]